MYTYEDLKDSIDYAKTVLAEDYDPDYWDNLNGEQRCLIGWLIKDNITLDPYDFYKAIRDQEYLVFPDHTTLRGCARRYLMDACVIDDDDQLIFDGVPKELAEYWECTFFDVDRYVDKYFQHDWDHEAFDYNDGDTEYYGSILIDASNKF